MDWHPYQLTSEEVLQKLNTNKKGLTSDKISQIREKVGNNSIPEKKIKFFEKYIRPVINLLIIILFLAACLQIWFYYAYNEGSLLGPIVVLAILFLNILIGMRQQYKAEKTLEALQRLSSFKATVIRDGKEQLIPAADLVPGDILLLKQGDYISADARIFEANELSIDESNLTGEVNPVNKIVDSIKDENSLQIQDQDNMIFNSTFVVAGNGKAIVTETGINTEIGKISKTIATQEKRDIPLQNKMNTLAKSLGFIVLGVIVILFVIQILRNYDTFRMEGFNYLINELVWLVSLAVAAIPFNFPLITTIILLTGVLKLAKKQAIIRNLNAVETMGRLNIICSDKTGTITAHQMTVQKIFFNQKVYEVTGIGYSPEGEIKLENNPITIFDNIYLWNMIKNGVINNNAYITKENVNIRKGTKEIYSLIGTPTEGALITLGQKAKINPELERKSCMVLKEFPFSGHRKRMSKVIKREDNLMVYSKGAPEIILSLCTNYIENNEIKPISENIKKIYLQKAEEFAQEGLRTLAFAHKKIDNWSQDTKVNEVEQNMVFSGIVGILDPPREGVKDAIDICMQAGVDVKMITGDYSITAINIAKQVKLFHDGDLIASGKEILDMTDEQIEKTKIFARVTPDDKLKIVKSLQNRNNIVAMTGDGVNDALALENADVGISMGLRGTDVAKNASDLILTDDSFNTIETALYHGRGLFNNIRSNIMFLLACNLVELIILSAIYIIFGLRAFSSNHLILLYATIHFFPPLGLMFDKYDQKIMKDPPKHPDEPLLNNSYKKLLFIQIATIFTVLIGVWICLTQDIIHINPTNLSPLELINPFSDPSNNYRIGYMYQGELELIWENNDLLILFKGQTMGFAILLLSEVGVALEARSYNRSMFKSSFNLLLTLFLFGVLGLMVFMLNYDLAQMYLGFLKLSKEDWIICLILAAIPLVITEIYKLTQ